MTLREARVVFTDLVIGLLQFAKESNEGILVAGDYWKRCKDCPVGHPNSTHKSGLAVDLVVYADLDGDGEKDDYSEDETFHRPIGEWWEMQHPLCRWGGRYGDPNHYSMEWNGVK